MAQQQGPPVVQWAQASASSDAPVEFFRRLGDPRRLAHTPIARACLERRPIEAPALGLEEAAAHIRAAVLDIAADFRRFDAAEGGAEQAERRYHGVVRCDLGREPAKCVAADLGVSIRQLRRDRSYAHQRIVRVLLGPSSSASARVLPDAVGLELGLARRLAESGRGEAATQILQSLAGGDISVERRVEVLAALAELFLDRNLPGDATEAVRTATEIARDVLRDEPTTVWRARLELAATALEFRQGDASRALAREDAMLAALQSGSRSDPETLAIVATILIDRGWRAASRGSWSAARAHADNVRSIVLGCGTVAPMALIDSQILESHVAFSQDGDLSRAGAAASRALEMAQREGFARRAAVAGLELADVQYRLGMKERGVATARAALEVARRVAAPTILSGAALGVADLELMSGRAEAAVPHLELAAAQVAEGSSNWARLQLAWADVFAQRGAAETALGHALAARSAAEGLSNGRLLGAALRRCAQAEHALGRLGIAAQTIRDALDVISRHGTRYALALGYEASFRLTGTPAHLRASQELFSQLAASGGQKAANVASSA